MVRPSRKTPKGCASGGQIEREPLSLAALQEIAATIKGRLVSADDDLEQRPRDDGLDDWLHAVFDEREANLHGLSFVTKRQIAVVIEMRQFANVDRLDVAAGCRGCGGERRHLW